MTKKILYLILIFLLIYPSMIFSQKKSINVELDDANVIDALKLLSSMSGYNIVADGSVKGKKITISLKDIAIMDALDLIVAATGLAYHITDNTIVVGSIEKLRSSNTAKTTEKIELHYIDADEARTILTSYVYNASDIQINVGTNEILITDVTSQIRRIKEVISEIDVAPKQIMLEAKVVEVASSDLKELGVNWSSAIAESIVEEGAATVKSLTDPIKLGRTPTLQITALLNYLSQQGKAKILASPKVATLNKKEASIDVSDRVPYSTKIVDAAGVVTLTMGTVDVGVSLKITPQVNAGGYITVKIKPKVSSVIEFSGPDSTYPRVASREAETVVRVKDGETIIIGGLNKNEERETIRKIPLLGDIPLIGLLFQNRRMENTNTEVIIFITPHILKEPESAR